MIKWLLCANELPHRATECSGCFSVPSPTGSSWEASLNYTVGIINWANLQPFIFWQLWPTKSKSQRRGEVLPTSQLQIAVNCKWCRGDRERENFTHTHNKKIIGLQKSYKYFLLYKYIILHANIDNTKKLYFWQSLSHEGTAGLSLYWKLWISLPNTPKEKAKVHLKNNHDEVYC